MGAGDGNLTARAFEDIYRKAGWGAGDSLSGAGSSLDTTEALCRVFMQAALRVMDDKRQQGQAPTLSVLDAPSGDWFWMPTCLERLDTVLPESSRLEYQGVDVASTAVRLSEERRQARQANWRHIEVAPFLEADLARPGEFAALVNGSTFDIVLSHDALQHNPTAQVREILRTFNGVGKHLIVDVDTKSHNDWDIDVGGVRFIDLTKPPYGFEPICADVNLFQEHDGEGEWFGFFKLPVPL